MGPPTSLSPAASVEGDPESWPASGISNQRPREISNDASPAISDVHTSPNFGSGVECRGSQTQSRQRVFYPVFTPGDDDGRLAALNPVPERRQAYARFGDRKPGKAGAIDPIVAASRKGGPDEALGVGFAVASRV